ncbi:MAG: hypothetical protein ACI4GB_04865 [Acutalibacteraceae bacterium]
MNDEKCPLDFTVNSEDDFYDTVDMSEFRDEDAELIYHHLHQKMRLIPFGDYLKRYIFKKAEFSGSIDDIDLKEYQEIIISSFSENNTPKSFEPTSAKISALAKNWLTQNAVKRQTVFLLGFGLNMSVEDVSEFLTHAQGERDFNFKNPFEVICWYCYKNRYKYPKFEQLKEAYDALSFSPESPYFDDATIGIRDLFYSIETEDDLMRKLSELKLENNGNFFSKSAKRSFDMLYQRVKEIIAEEYTRDEQEKCEKKARLYRERLGESLAFSYEDKIKKYSTVLESARIYRAEDISESDVEKYLCCGIPFDGKGNLYKFSLSKLKGHFSSKRMSRQHLREILTEKVDVDRFDLITLCFFIHAMDDSVSNKRRYIEFTDDINAILESCCMGELYIANPYECFLLMCILSDWPMCAYSDVFEKAYLQ